MGPVIDIVGHFGTTYSYATVGSKIAEVLKADGLLGAVSNMDDDWHPSHEHLRTEKSIGTHVLVFSAPNHYLDAFASQYGRERSALFMSPNTDTLAIEHAETCSKFGLAIVPSKWCEKTVANARYFERHPPQSIAVLPLGVSPAYAEGRQQRMDDLAARAMTSCRLLHVSTDQCWPGRKGTEELIEAWSILKEQKLLPGLVNAELVIHVPNSLMIGALYRCRDFDVDDTVTVVKGETKGSSENALVELLDGIDMVVAPSRCEGFGMMFLASIVAGVPLVATYNTGHVDFMFRQPGWVGIPTSRVDRIEYEEGDAPVIEPETLADTLYLAMQPQVRKALLVRMGATFGGRTPDHARKVWGTWPVAQTRWRNRIKEWAQETA